MNPYDQDDACTIYRGPCLVCDNPGTDTDECTGNQRYPFDRYVWTGQEDDG